MTAIKNY